MHVCATNTNDIPQFMQLVRRDALLLLLFLAIRFKKNSFEDHLTSVIINFASLAQVMQKKKKKNFMLFQLICSHVL